MTFLAWLRKRLRERRESRQWRCRHLHLTDLGYCPQCETWVDDDWKAL